MAELNAFGRLQAETRIEQAELLHAQLKRTESALVPHLVPDWRSASANSTPRQAG